MITISALESLTSFPGLEFHVYQTYRTRRWNRLAQFADYSESRCTPVVFVVVVAINCHQLSASTAMGLPPLDPLYHVRVYDQMTNAHASLYILMTAPYDEYMNLKCREPVV